MKRMKKLLLLLTALVCLVGCSKEKDETKKLDITVKTGESYRFNENTITVSEAPNDFIAEIENNEVIGVHAGKTKMSAKVGGVTYDCNIKVDAKNTYYADMAMYLGQSKESIIALYGEPLKVSKDTYFFGKLMNMDMLPELENRFVIVDNKVVTCAIYFKISSGVSIVNHLKDRYAVYGTKDYVTMMGDSNDPDKRNVVVMYDYSGSYAIVIYTTQAYLDKDKSKNSIIMMDQFRDVL